MKKTSNALKVFLCIIAIIAGLCLADYLIAFHTGSENRYVGFDGDFSNSGIIDENGIFDDDPQTLSELGDLVRDCSKKLNMNILIFLPDSSRSAYSDDDVRDFTANKYNAVFGENTDGLLYYIDISGKSPACDDIAKSARVSLIFPDSTCQSIFSILDEYLPPSYGPVYPEHITNAITNFCALLESYYNSNDISGYYHDSTATPPVYVYEKGGKSYVTTSKPPMLKLIICIAGELIGALTALISYLAAKSRYKFKSKTSPSIYLSNENAKFIERSDTLIRTYVTKHRIQSNSGGGGSRGGGGGHSHGGSISHSSHHR